MTDNAAAQSPAGQAADCSPVDDAAALYRMFCVLAARQFRCHPALALRELAKDYPSGAADAERIGRRAGLAEPPQPVVLPPRPPRPVPLDSGERPKTRNTTTYLTPPGSTVNERSRREAAAEQARYATDAGISLHESGHRELRPVVQAVRDRNGMAGLGPSDHDQQGT